MLINGGIAMKKGLMLAAGVAGAAFIVSGVMKKFSRAKTKEKKVVNENTSYESENKEKKPDSKKMQNHNENAVRVHNSLISIKIKLLSR
jgi:hypothetical protein